MSSDWSSVLTPADTDAFGALSQRYAPRLRRTILRIIQDRDAAEDVVLKALTRAWINIGRFERRARFSTWRTRIGCSPLWMF